MDMTKHPPLQPAFVQNNIAIAVSCSEYYSLYGAEFLASLAEHSSPDWNYDILIFTKDITPATQTILQNTLGGRQNISLRYLDVNAYLKKYALKTHAHFGIESYFRLLYPYVLENYEKVLYFDCDMVFKTDIVDLWQMDIGKAFLGASVDAVVVGAVNDKEDRTFGEYGWYNYCVQKLGMDDPYRYFNSGVLILNLVRFRQEYAAEFVLRDAQEKQYYLLDQDALNALTCKDNVLIDIAWNMTTDVGGYKMPYIRKAPHYIQDAYTAAREHPHTVHFADSRKPWKNPNEDLGYEFWVVARKLPIYSRILCRMFTEQMQRVTAASAILGSVRMPWGIAGEWKWKLRQWKAKIKAKLTHLRGSLRSKESVQ